MESDWLEVGDGFSLVRAWLLSPDSPESRTALQLREELAGRLNNNTGPSLNLTDLPHNPRYVKAAAFLNASHGAPACPNESPPLPALPPPSLPPPLTPPLSPPVMLQPLPLSPPPSPSLCLNMTMYDEFGDGWGGIVLNVRSLAATSTDDAVRTLELSSGSLKRSSVCLPGGCYALRAGERAEGDALRAEEMEMSWELADCGGMGSGMVSFGEEVRLCVLQNGKNTSACSMLLSPSAPPVLSPSMPPNPPSAPTELPPSPAPSIPPTPPVPPAPPGLPGSSTPHLPPPTTPPPPAMPRTGPPNNLSPTPNLPPCLPVSAPLASPPPPPSFPPSIELSSGEAFGSGEASYDGALMTEAPFPTRPPLVAVVASPPLPSPSPPPLNMPSSLVQQPTVASRGLQPGDGGCPTLDDRKAQANANLEAASEFLVTLTFVTASLVILAYGLSTTGVFRKLKRACKRWAEDCRHWRRMSRDGSLRKEVSEMRSMHALALGASTRDGEADEDDLQEMREAARARLAQRWRENADRAKVATELRQLKEENERLQSSLSGVLAQLQRAEADRSLKLAQFGLSEAKRLSKEAGKRERGSPQGTELAKIAPAPAKEPSTTSAPGPSAPVSSDADVEEKADKLPHRKTLPSPGLAVTEADEPEHDYNDPRNQPWYSEPSVAAPPAAAPPAAAPPAAAPPATAPPAAAPSAAGSSVADERTLRRKLRRESSNLDGWDEGAEPKKDGAGKAFGRTSSGEKHEALQAEQAASRSRRSQGASPAQALSQAGHPASTTSAVQGAKAKARAAHDWTTGKWIQALELHELVSSALLAPLQEPQPPSLAQFAYCKGLTREMLHQLLHDGTLLDDVEEAVWSGIEQLTRSAASSGAELSTKFAVDANFTLAYGALSTFFGGLEAILGAPSMQVLQGMEREHCGMDDADAWFKTSNGMHTTSRVEFEFVTRPVEGKKYPERSDLIAWTPHHRKPLPPEAFAETLAKKNAQLAKLGHPGLMQEEAIAGRIYTGPIYEKLNAILRSHSGNAFLKKRCDELCLGNTYTTTIHAVSSCVLKLSKLAVVTKVYRGLQGAALPDSFFEPDDFGVCGGVEFGFTSTSSHKAEALAYALSTAGSSSLDPSSAKCPTVLEIDQGMLSRGADMSEFSQYPHEKEVLFSPLLGVEVLGSRVEGGVLVVQMGLTVNVTQLTIEQQLSKRRRLVQQMCDNIRVELKAELKAEQRWRGMHELRSLLEGGTNGHEFAEATLNSELVASTSKPPEFYNDDQAWGDMIARAVAAKQAVELWPEALHRLCEASKLEPAALLHAEGLVLSFKPFGQPEAEVLELLLRVSPALRAMNLYNGGIHGNWVDRDMDGNFVHQEKWGACVASVARGVGASRSLVTLNLRHFSLSGTAGEAIAAAVCEHATLTTLRLVNCGLTPAALSRMLSKNKRLTTFALNDNALPDGHDLEAMAKFGGRNLALKSLSLMGCSISPAAGKELAEMVRTNTAKGGQLQHLDLSRNKLDADFVMSLAEALRGNARLTDINMASNDITNQFTKTESDQQALDALKRVQRDVQVAWEQTDEGRAEAKARRSSNSKASSSSGLSAAMSIVGDLLKG